MDTEETPVMFRVLHGGEVLALMVADCYNVSPWECTAYAHVGQHHAASIGDVISVSRPADCHDYKDLKEELESMGYRVHVVRRDQFYHTRHEQVKERLKR